MLKPPSPQPSSPENYTEVERRALVIFFIVFKIIPFDCQKENGQSHILCRDRFHEHRMIAAYVNVDTTPHQVSSALLDHKQGTFVLVLNASLALKELKLFFPE